MHHIRLIAIRPNNAAPFFWESQDPEIVELLEYIDTKSATLSHLYSGYEKRPPPDLNTPYFVDWYFNSFADWETFKAEMIKDRPDVFDRRDDYFIEHGHLMYVKIFNEHGVETDNATVIPKPVTP